MENVVVDAYKFRKIASAMAKTYGTMPKGDEELYAFELSAMETNLLKLHRLNPQCTGRHAEDAILLSLLTIDGYLRDVEYDFSKFSSSLNQDFFHGLLMSFDPFTNEAIRELVMAEENQFVAHEYFKIPVQCLLRIQKSIELWTKEWGPNGYFVFIEQQMGPIVGQDDEMIFAISGTD